MYYVEITEESNKKSTYQHANAVAAKDFVKIFECHSFDQGIKAHITVDNSRCYFYLIFMNVTDL